MASRPDRGASQRVLLGDFTVQKVTGGLSWTDAMLQMRTKVVADRERAADRR